MSDIAPSFNASKITERLLVGGGIAGPDEIAWLAAQGVTHIISAAAELDDAPLATPAGISCRHVQWNDDGQPKPASDFLATYAWLAEQEAALAASGKQSAIYVHCAAGCNRGPLLATFLLAGWSGLSAETVWTLFVKAQRPIVSALDNANYRQSVETALEQLRQLRPAGELPTPPATAPATPAVVVAVGVTDGAKGTSAKGK